MTYLAELNYLTAYMDRQDKRFRQVIEVLHNARLNGRRVFICGNGGSATTADHFACDLIKAAHRSGVPPVQAIALTCNLAAITAFANDDGYDSVFSAQLDRLAGPGDILVAISTSGWSQNVIHAAYKARDLGMLVIGLTGSDGGFLRNLSDYELHVPDPHADLCEDLHLAFCHLITRGLREYQPA